MSRGDKPSYTDKHKREAPPIEDKYRSRGVSSKRAERIAWATVYKQDAGSLDKRR